MLNVLRIFQKLNDYSEGCSLVNDALKTIEYERLKECESFDDVNDLVKERIYDYILYEACDNDIMDYLTENYDAYTYIDGTIAEFIADKLSFDTYINFADYLDNDDIYLENITEDDCFSLLHNLSLYDLLEGDCENEYIDGELTKIILDKFMKKDGEKNYKTLKQFIADTIINEGGF